MRQIAPVNLRIYHETAEILGLFGAREAPLPRISIVPGDTEASLLGLFGCLALFLACATLMRSRARRRVFAGVVLAAGLLQAPFLLSRGAGAPAREGTFAVSLGLGAALLVGFGSLWAALLTGAERASDAPDRAEQFERRFTPVAIRALVCLVLGTALVLCRIPASVAAAAAALAVGVVLGAVRRRTDARRRAGGALISLFFAATLLAFTTAFAPETDGATAPSSRVDAVRASALDAWREFPIVGSGLGTFREAFRRVQPRALTGLVESAHSEFLETLVTMGVTGAALAVLVVTSLLVLLLKAWRAQRHREESAVVLAAFGALLFWTLATLAESSPDSASALPLLAAVLGTGWAASRAHGGRLV